jgi:hypothetical protein
MIGKVSTVVSTKLFETLRRTSLSFRGPLKMERSSCQVRGYTFMHAGDLQQRCSQAFYESEKLILQA